MYEVGQKINIGYYGGFHNQTLIKAQAEVIRIDGYWVTIRIQLSCGGYKTMFGTENQLKELKKNFCK